MLWRSLALCGLALTLAPCAQAAEPIEGKTVYIDAGHGGEDSGAVGNGLFEKDINLAVSEHVTDKLKEEGANPVASRSDDHFLTLEERVAKASANQADLFVSIHVNSGLLQLQEQKRIFNLIMKGRTAGVWHPIFSHSSFLPYKRETGRERIRLLRHYIFTNAKCVGGAWVYHEQL